MAELTIGRKVFGNWGIGGGWNYGVITDVQTDAIGTDIIVNWEDWEGDGDGTGRRYDINEVVISDECTNLDAVGIYLLPVEEA